MSAALPSPDSATVVPCLAGPTAPEPTSFSPDWVHVEPERVNTHTAPTLPLSPAPPRSAVLPSAESATELPKRPPCSPLASPPPVSFPPCCVHTDPKRVKTHTAPMDGASLVVRPSPDPPTTAVLPSADSATLSPKLAKPTSPAPSRRACCVQTPPD